MRPAVITITCERDRGHRCRPTPCTGPVQRAAVAISLAAVDLAQEAALALPVALRRPPRRITRGRRDFCKSAAAAIVCCSCEYIW